MKRKVKLSSIGLVIVVIMGLGILPAMGAGIKMLAPGKPNPQVDFKGITIRALEDAGAGRILEWYAPLLEKECGVKILRTEMVDFPKLREKAMGDLLSGKPSWQLIQIRPAYLADFVRTGKIECLDPYFNEYDQDQVKAYLNDVMPAYREFYMKFKDKYYAIPFDGDVHVFNYRISYFNNPKYKEEFKKEYGKELKPPETWDDYILLCKFFKKVLPKDMYPTMWWILAPDGAAFYFDIAASYGVKYFSEDMEHALWPRDKAIAAMKKMVETVPYCPPGVASFGFPETVDYWLAGKVVMQDWFIDINEWGQMGTPKVKGDVANSLLPGYRDPKTGKVTHRAMMPYNRFFIIPKDLPKKVKEAAFYVAYHISRPEYAMHSCADVYCGMDPYLKSLYSDEAASCYLTPNPLRGVAPDWPENVPLFTSFAETRKHLDTGLASVKVGFPEICWPGSTRYTLALAKWVSKAMARVVTPEEAINNAAKEWEKIRDDLGRKEQQKFYADFVKKCKKLGYW